MKHAEHKKQLLIQQIADHRARMQLEIEVLQESNPAKPVIEGGRRLLGVLGALRGGHNLGSIAAPRRQLDVEIVRTTLPVVLVVMRALSQRHKERRARKEGM